MTQTNETYVGITATAAATKVSLPPNTALPEHPFLSTVPPGVHPHGCTSRLHPILKKQLLQVGLLMYLKTGIFPLLNLLHWTTNRSLFQWGCGPYRTDVSAVLDHLDPTISISWPLKPPAIALHIHLVVHLTPFFPKVARTHLPVVLYITNMMEARLLVIIAYEAPLVLMNHCRFSTIRN